MEYHAWQSLLDESRRIDSECRAAPLATTYRIDRRRIENFGFQFESNRIKRLLRIDAEYEWEKTGRPFYHVHPDIVPAIAKTNLDSVPARLIEIPRNYPAVSICFAKGREPSGLFALLFARQQNGFLFVLDCGNRQTFGEVPITLCTTLRLVIAGDETIPEALNCHFDSLPEQLAAVDAAIETVVIEQMKDQLLNAIRTAITIGFLANQNDELVIRDVLSKDRTAYHDALRNKDATRLAVIEERATRRGKSGWNVGTNEFVIPWFSAAEKKSAAYVRGPQTRAHIRTGHFRAVRFGEGRSRVKVKWFRPTVVRPDLPFCPEVCSDSK